MKVAVFGAKGRMGAECCRAAVAAGHELVAALDVGDDRAPAAAADVAIDFTHPDAVMDTITWCLEHDVNMVIGTTGFTEERLESVREQLADKPELGVVIAANFSIGAVLMMAFSELAAKHYESVEVIELHHPNKADAPSGTATVTAQRIAHARAEAGLGTSPDATVHALDGARGAKVDDVTVHSVRLRGLVAHQEVLFGAEGETLTIRHDSFDRVSFMPGVMAAVAAVVNRPGLTLGIDEIIGL